MSDGGSFPNGASMAIPPIVSAEQFIRETEALIATPFKSKFGALFLSDLDAPGEEHEFLIEGWLSVGDRSVMGGPSRSGKSFLAIHAGMCIAMGIDFFGAPVKPGLVIYQCGEGARGAKKRLRAWRSHHKTKYGPETPFVLMRAAIDLYTPEGDTQKFIEEILAIAKMFEVPLRLIVIDTLSTATAGADENSGRDMSTVMQNIAKISSATGGAVLLVHHMNAGGTKLRGHTSVYANVDQVILVTRNDTTKVRTAVLDKQKDEEDGARLQFELPKIVLGHQPNGREITSCVCVPVGEREAIRRAEENKGYHLTDQNILFMRALFDADKKYGQHVPVEMTGVPKQVRSIVGYDDVKRFYVALSPSDTVDSDAQTPADPEVVKTRHREMLKKRLQRAREFLTTAGVIGTDGKHIWWSGRPLRAFPHTLPREEINAEAEDPNAIPF